MANTTTAPTASPWSSVASGAISAGGSLLSSIVNNLWEDSRAKEQREWNEQMMDKQNQWSLEMWNKTNEYNDPGAQVQRIRNAGLNPLYYGLDGSSANGLESAQALGYERASLPNGMPNLGQSFLEGSLKQAQLDNINADTAKKSQETISEVERQQNLKKERDEMDARIQSYKSRAKVDEKTAEKIDKEISRYDEYMDAIINRNNVAASLDEQQRKRIEELLPGEKELQSYSIKEFAKKWSLWQAQINHMCAQDLLLAKQSKNYLLTLLTNGVYGTGLSAVNALILHEINNDPDLTDKERDAVKDAFGLNDDDKKSKDDSKSDDPRDMSKLRGAVPDADFPQGFKDAVRDGYNLYKSAQ